MTYILYIIGNILLIIWDLIEILHSTGIGWSSFLVGSLISNTLWLMIFSYRSWHYHKKDEGILNVINKLKYLNENFHSQIIMEKYVQQILKNNNTTNKPK